MRRVFPMFLAVLVILSGCEQKSVAPTDFLAFSAPADLSNVETICYGKSGSGQYELTAYRFGTGENVLLLTFCIHGWEDAFERDGGALVELGNATACWMDAHMALVELGDWSVYVLPCLNPDGLYFGTTADGCGRCTYTSEDGTPMDINRCFPYAYTSCGDPRYYNGQEPLGCTEGTALAAFTQSIIGSGRNMVVDVHGWYQQILTESPQSFLYSVFSSWFPDHPYTSLEAGYGYFSAWCSYVLGFEACLLELPEGINSMEAYRQSGCEAAFLSAMEQILRNESF